MIAVGPEAGRTLAPPAADAGPRAAGGAYSRLLSMWAMALSRSPNFSRT